MADSSPLTRGKHVQEETGQPRFRLIPAHAGKTLVATAAVDAVWAHPRSRGENPYGYSPSAVILGSSPLTRGKQAASCGCCVATRLIPTHAGKPLPNHDQTGVSKPHPRSRGENSVYGIAITAMSGSSPLTRGKRRDRRNHILTVGLIPAHAGKTLEDRRSRAQALAHPRSRGENRSTGSVVVSS